MNKRQRKKAVKRKYEKMAEMMEHAHRHYMKFAIKNTHLPMVRWNLAIRAEQRVEEQQQEGKGNW